MVHLFCLLFKFNNNYFFINVLSSHLLTMPVKDFIYLTFLLKKRLFCLFSFKLLLFCYQRRWMSLLHAFTILWERGGSFWLQAVVRGPWSIVHVNPRILGWVIPNRSMGEGISPYLFHDDITAWHTIFSVSGMTLGNYARSSL